MTVDQRNKLFIPILSPSGYGWDGQKQDTGKRAFVGNVELKVAFRMSFSVVDADAMPWR